MKPERLGRKRGQDFGVHPPGRVVPERRAVEFGNRMFRAVQPCCKRHDVAAIGLLLMGQVNAACALAGNPISPERGRGLAELALAAAERVGPGTEAVLELLYVYALLIVGTAMGTYDGTGCRRDDCGDRE